MSTLEQAIALAAEKHAGQADKAGQPYILHPLRVMLNVETEEQKIVAVLHDVLEDTATTLDELRDYGFSTPQLDALLALTKQAGEDRIAAAQRAAQNRIACRVKLADVADNMDISRLEQLSDKDHTRLAQYQQVKQILLEAYAHYLQQ